MSTKTSIEKLIKALYAFVEEHKQYIEDVEINNPPEGLSEEEEYGRDQLLGAQLLADLKLQDAMLVWINANNPETLTIQQLSDLFGLLNEFRFQNMGDVQ